MNTEIAKEFNKEFKQVYKMLNNQSMILSDINEALLGNKYNKRGFAERLEMVEVKAEVNTAFRMKVVYISSSVGAVAGFMLSFVSDIISKRL